MLMTIRIRHEPRLSHRTVVQNQPLTAIQGFHSSFDIPNSPFLHPVFILLQTPGPLKSHFLAAKRNQRPR
jgi:hypothetical protein